jgi:hypothetical protein
MAFMKASKNGTLESNIGFRNHDCRELGKFDDELPKEE